MVYKIVITSILVWQVLGNAIGIMQCKAIIFDVDGTLANTERYGHLPACNSAFKKMGLPFNWSWEYFQLLLKKIQGNANRLKSELQNKFELSQHEIKSIIDEFEVLKKEYYITTFLPQIKLRDGVKDFIEDVIHEKMKIAIVSTSYELQINELIKNQLPDYYNHFNPILGKESGIKTGEDGVLYSACVEKLGLSPSECLVIEDSEIGLKAALKAGLKTIITYNEYTRDEDFTGAYRVVESLNEIDWQEITTSFTENYK